MTQRRDAEYLEEKLHFLIEPYSEPRCQRLADELPNSLVAALPLLAFEVKTTFRSVRLPGFHVSHLCFGSRHLTAQHPPAKESFVKLIPILTGLMFLGIASAAAAQTEKKGMTLAIAKQVIAAAVNEAKNNNAPGGAIAVVDEGGHVVALERLDHTFAAGANISIGKARTAALFKRPTKFFEDVINKGRTAMAALPDFTPLQGGVPIVLDGEIIGAVGVSGAASAQQDEELAIAGANALGRQAPRSK
jgi:glc operon protein GlcG